MNPQNNSGFDWANPQYWAAWNDTFASLGGAVGSWVDVLDPERLSPRS